MRNKKMKLEENYDFIVVPSLVWAVIVKLYSGGPEISY